MGLASSQARMLLLTSRKSDLEFRAQQITNAEMVLAMNTEDVARKYSLKISNQTLRYMEPSETKELNFSAKTLPELTANSGSPLNIQYKGDDGKWYDWSDTPTTVYTKDGKTYTESQLNAMNLSDADKALYTPKTIPAQTNNPSAKEILMGIQAETYRIVNTNSGKLETLDGTTRLSQGYYTEDDAEAEALYKRETASIQIKEKRLQMDLQQIETQQKACDTEMDSVKKIMDKNIERTFKVFS